MLIGCDKYVNKSSKKKIILSLKVLFFFSHVTLALSKPLNI